MAVQIYDELESMNLELDNHHELIQELLGRVAALEGAVLKSPMRLGVVSYLRSTTAWDSIMAAKPALAMINPGSGPGPAPDSLYVGLVPKCRAAGVPVFGYVHTKYGTRPVAEVKADILNHKTWYGIDGIFVDTTSTKPELVPYYADLCVFIKAQGLKVCLNPGTAGPEVHAQIADYVMVSETYWDTYKAQVRPSWEAKYPGKLWHVIHTCPTASMPEAVALAKSRGGGLVYVTDDLMPNPYDRLPAYWADLVAAVKAAG